jgi:hypothetical protein
MASELDNGSVASSSTIADDEPRPSAVKRRERGFAAIRDPNLQLLTQMVTRRVTENILFINAFPSDDELDKYLADAWKIAEKSAGYVAQRTKAVNQVVSTIFWIVIVNAIDNFGSSGKVRAQLGATWSGVPKCLLPAGTTSEMEAPIRH